MKTANIAKFKSHLSEYMHYAEAGEHIRICKRNIAIAELVPVCQSGSNKTHLGCGKNTVEIKGSLTDPVFELKDWDMLVDSP
ncbi:MAG: hypothetical protein EOM20_05740 [Spartobacteria bacterium]|nr:hypothetical protein [Spartobacteria bacterium]